ncbi:facilitated trehalose transporter Tret1-like isoform X2 [Periplaneta americana]
MQAANHQPSVTEEEASWIASLISIGMPVGCLLIGPLLDRLGRRRTLMLVNLPALLGWLLIASAPHDWTWFLVHVYTGRLLTGLTVHLTGTPAVIYTSEVVDKNLRGVVGSWPALGFSLGIVLVYILGLIFQQSWRIVAGICASSPVIAIVAVWFFLPESPVWLATKGKFEAAESSIRRIRMVSKEEPLPEDLQEELEAMIEKKTSQDSDKNTWRETLAFLKRPEAYKPLLIINAFFFFQQWSGILVFIVYTVTLIIETGIEFDGYLATVLVGVARLIMSIVSSYLSKRCGRRTLAITSGAGLALSTGALAVFLGQLTRQQVAEHSWFVVLALVFGVAMATLGFLPLPFVILGEMFPLRIRASASGFTTCLASLFSFVAVKLLPFMKHWLGFHNVFVFYFIMAAAGTVMLYFFLPETHGKTLDEIEQGFRGGGDGKSASDKYASKENR